MFGLEKQPEKNKNRFEFDLEKDLIANPAHKKKLSHEIEENILQIKDVMRKGLDSEEELEKFGVILRGYAALQKVVNRIGKH
jgi:hypothetical protein